MNQTSNSFLASFLKPNPERDWFLVLSIVVVPCIFFIGYAVYLFFGIQSGFVLHKTPTTFPAQTITVEEIQSALETYRSRKARYDINVVPSIPTGASSFIAPKSSQ